MSTSQALQEMPVGKFEKLATAVLRKHNPEYAHVLHTGINAEGKPIPSALDGFCLIPHSDPPHFLLVEHTTTEKPSDLKKKWLHDHTTVKIRKPVSERKTKLPSESDDGDLIKAGREARKRRKKHPNAIFTVILTTNRGLSTELADKVYDKAEELKVAVDFWERSRIVEFLDYNPEGQYLRQELLGIEANRLSESLLRKIARLSLDHHRHRFAIGEGSQFTEIVRDVHPQLVNVIEGSGASLIGLQGASGTGKSTLLQQIGKEINAKGGIALWVPAEHVEPGTSIGHLLHTVLSRFHSSLNAQAGEDAVRLAYALPGGIVLLVDDINRLPLPEQASRTIESWNALITEDKKPDNHSRRSQFQFIVPTWPGQFTADLGPARGEGSKWRYVEICSYSTHERSLLANVLTEQHSTETQQAIDVLDGDPFLCGFLSTDVIIPGSISRSSLVQRIFNKALHDAVKEATLLRRVQATPNEFATAIDKLIELMVHCEEPELNWERVRDSLGDRIANILHILSDTNQLGWIESREGKEVWRWKHDRLRDALIGRWLANNVLSQTVDERQTGFSNPGLAEAWALALIFLTDVDARAKALTFLAEFQPLAIAEALRLNLFPTETNLRRMIAKSLAQTLNGFDGRAPEFVDSPRQWILDKLSQTSDPLVLEITQNLPPSRLVWAAIFRNGDISAGLNWLCYDSGGDFLPTVKYSFLEQSIEAFVRLKDCRRNDIAVSLAQSVEQPKLSTAAMTLAGYLAWPELARPVWSAWDALSDDLKLDTLVPIVWALNRCGDDSIQTELEDALLLSRRLSDEDKIEERANYPGDRHWHFMSPLWLAHRWPITPESAQTWAKVANEHSDLCETMCFVLRGIDHPAAMEAYVRWSAEKGGTFWDDAGEPLDPLAKWESVPRTPTNTVTRDHLWTMVESESDLTTRKIAFRFWKRLAEISDLERLRSLAPDDALFDETLKVRLRLRDETAAELLIERMKSDPGAWCGYAPLLYDEPGVAETLLVKIEDAFKENPWLSIPAHLPPHGVRKLIQARRDLLLKSPRTWLSLWRSDVPEALELVQTVVKQAGSDDLEFFFLKGGFPFPVSRRMLNTLVPVLECFPAKERKRLAELAVRNGFADWVQDHLLDVALASHFWITEEEVVDILAKAAELVSDGPVAVRRNSEISTLRFRLKDNYSGLTTDIIEILQKWLGSTPDENQIIVAAMLLVTFGTGRHIDWWQSFEPRASLAHTVWSSALYILKREYWHN